jgi:hypothetical protein
MSYSKKLVSSFLKDKGIVQSVNNVLINTISTSIKRVSHAVELEEVKVIDSEASNDHFTAINIEDNRIEDELILYPVLTSVTVIRSKQHQPINVIIDIE